MKKFLGFWTTQRENLRFLNEKRQEFAELEELREKYPQPKLWKKIKMGEYGSPGLKFADLRNTGKMDILVIQAGRKGVSCLTAINIEGELIWQLGEPNSQQDNKGGIFRLQVYDIDADGKPEVVAVMENKLVVIEGATGRLKIWIPIPLASPFEGLRHAKIDPVTFMGLYIVNFLGDNTRQILLKGGAYRGVWTYDHNLNLLWSLPSIWYGHHAAFYDVNGDGREEAVIGHNLVDGEGKIIWRTEGSESLTEASYHVDCVVVGEIDGNKENGPEVAMVCGDLGFLLLDKNGKIRQKDSVGHAQTLSVGNYRPDLKGLEIWVCTRWRNYGIRTLYSGEGKKIFSFEPDNSEGAGAPINWKGNGEELALHTSSKECFGLYDAFGRKVVEFPEDGHPVGVPSYGHFFHQ